MQLEVVHTFSAPPPPVGDIGARPRVERGVVEGGLGAVQDERADEDLVELGGGFGAEDEGREDGEVGARDAVREVERGGGVRQGVRVGDAARGDAKGEGGREEEEEDEDGEERRERRAGWRGHGGVFLEGWVVEKGGDWWGDRLVGAL